MFRVDKQFQQQQQKRTRDDNIYLTISTTTNNKVNNGRFAIVSDRMKSNSNNSSNICLNKHIIIIIYRERKLWRREVFRFVANRKSVTYFFSTSRLEFESEIRQNIYLSSLSLERNNYHICTILLMVWRANNIHIYASSSSFSSSTLSLSLFSSLLSRHE